MPTEAVQEIKYPRKRNHYTNHSLYVLYGICKKNKALQLNMIVHRPQGKDDKKVRMVS